MKKLKQMNWKSTIAGIVGLAMIGYGGYKDPASLVRPETVAGASASVGLLFAADSKKKTK